MNLMISSSHNSFALEVNQSIFLASKGVSILIFNWLDIK